MEKSNNIIHGLWIGEQLSPIEILCIKSYQKSGHIFYLWTYKTIENIPEGTILKNANEILNETRVFRYKNTNKFGHGKGSLAGFSDIFRYKLLYEFGGWWTDMDITCLKPFDFVEPYIFRKNGDKGIVGNIMKCEAESELMRYCYERASKEVNENNKDWLLPITILNDGIKKFDLLNYTKELSNEDSWTFVCDLLIHDYKIARDWYAIHWMNEEWRRLSVNKNSFLKDSLIENLLTEFNVQYKLLNAEEIKKLEWNIGIWNYRIVNLKARIKWLFNL